MALPAAIGSLLGEGVFGKLAAASFNVQALVGGVKSLGSVITNVLTTAVTGPVVPALKAMAGAVQLVQAPVLHVVDAIRIFRDSVGALGAAVSEFVRLASPVHVQRFNLAMDDLTASFGKILIPILEASTDVVRVFADVIFALSGPLQQLMRAVLDPFVAELPKLVTAFSPVVSLFGDFIGLTASVLTPVMKVMVPVLEGLAVVLAGLAAPVVLPAIVGLIAVLAGAFTTLLVTMGPVIAVLAGIGYAFQELVKWLSKMLGIKSIGGGSVGAAVRPATIGSVEDYGRKAQQAAFSLGTAATPEATTADYVQKLYEFLTGGFWAQLKALLPGGETLTAAATAARDAGRHVEEGTASTGERIFDAATLGGVRRGLGL